MKMSKLLATSALCLSLGTGIAAAAPLTGTVAINTGFVMVTPPNIEAGSQVTFTGATFGTGTPVLNGLVGTPLTPSVLTLTQDSTFTFTSPIGNFTGVNNVDIAYLIPGIGALVIAEGEFAPAGVLAGYDVTDFRVTIEVNQSGAMPTVSFNGTFSMASLAPPGGESIPEPMTLALFGMGLAGLGAAMRRRA